MALPSLRRGPSLGAIALLVLLVVVLVSGDGGDGEGPRDARPDRHREGGGAPSDDERDNTPGRDSAGDGGHSNADGGGDSAAPRTRGVLAPVVDIVDGDTIEVLLEGVEEDVRYIGVDTPESVAPGEPVECFGERASDFNARLVAGEEVRLVFDAERRDVYGRLLAYVYVGERFVNAALVRRGYARTLTIAPNDSFEGLFARLQQAAGNAGRGLWGACGP